MEASLTSRDVSVNLNIVRVAVQRVDLDVEVGGDERLTDVISWGDWGEKRHNKADLVVDGLMEDGLGRRVLERGLVDLCNSCARTERWSTHPDIRNAVNSDYTGPASDLSPSTC